MYRNAHEHRDSNPSYNRVLGTQPSPDTKSSFLKKQTQLAVLICHWGGPPLLQVLDVDSARGPGQDQSHKAAAGLLGFPHDSHGHKTVWKDGLLGHRAQVILEKVPDIDIGCIILDQEHSRPRRRPVQVSNRVATGAAVPLQDRLLRPQLV